jgi:hypothetical protein
MSKMGSSAAWLRDLIHKIFLKPERFSREELHDFLSRDLTYDNVNHLLLLLIRRYRYIDDTVHIRPSDELVGTGRFGSDDISYFVDEMEEALGIDIPQDEWSRILTFDDMTKLLMKHLVQLQGTK